jgi:hypothetical protein
MVHGMSTDADHNATGKSSADKHETIGGVLVSALDMEDQISSGVYEEYLNRQHWPGQLDDATLVEIKQRLAVLIEDTKKHKKILQALVKEHGSNR